MWKSGTRHVSMARATYLARPIAVSSTVTPSGQKNYSKSLMSRCEIPAPGVVELTRLACD
jgi:hypothetical protein